MGLLFSTCHETGDVTPESKFDNLELTAEEQERLILLDSNYFYSYEQAKADALQIAKELDAQDNKGRAIENVIPFSIPDTIRFPTKASEIDPGIFIFNFTGNGGFAIISSDERMPNRLGWSDNGNLDTAEPAPVFQMVLPRLINLTQKRRQEVEAMRGDKYHISLLEKIAGIKSDTAKGKTNGRVDPCQYARTTGCPDQGCSKYPIYTTIFSGERQNFLVPALLRTNWGQSPPYNNNFNGAAVGRCATNSGILSITRGIDCSRFSNNNLLAGCVPISEAMVATYFYGIRGITPGEGILNNFGVWNRIASTQTICDPTLNNLHLSTAADLIARIFANYNYTMGLCGEGTFTFNRDIFGAIGEATIAPRFGFQQRQFRDFYSTDVTASLQEGSPVLVQGFSRSLTFDICYPAWGWPPWNCVYVDTGIPLPWSGHQWVMDGVLDLNRETQYLITPVDYQNCQYLPATIQTSVSRINRYHHSNWGWSGQGNGWFLTDTFGYTGLDASIADSYKYGTKMLGNINPR